MNDQSRRSTPVSPETSPIFSPDAAAGISRSNSPAGRATGRSGRARVRASRSATPGDARAYLTRDMSGRLGDDLSPSAGLQRSLANRLRATLACNGSPEFALIWKRWVTPSGPPICALRASARRAADNDCGGALWPWAAVTRNAYEASDVERLISRRSRVRESQQNGNGFGLAIGQEVLFTPWPAVTATSAEKTPWRVGQAACTIWTHGETSTSSSGGNPAARSGLALNAEFCRWLQGYPAGWSLSGNTETRSCRRSARFS